MRAEILVSIYDCLAKNSTPATLVFEVTVDEVDEAVGLWSPHLAKKERELRRRVQHSHWDWSKKARAIQGAQNYSIVGVRNAEALQGLLLWDDMFERARHPSQLGKDIVYVHFLMTAPWNDRDIDPAPRYAGVGTLLIRAAVERSFDLGFKGRLGLHSLTQSEPFYRDRCQMADLGPDTRPDHQGLKYFELTPELAEEFIKRTGGEP